MVEVAVIDYGAGNLRSVAQALEHSGAVPVVTNDPAKIVAADKIILPGVGAFPAAMHELARQGLDEAVKEAVGRGSLLLGICLGMQLLFDSSEEFGTTAGLGLVPGNVIQIPTVTSEGALRKVPHIGWNELRAGPGGDLWGRSVLRSIPLGSPVYFLHSFMANPTFGENLVADSLVDDLLVTAVVQRDNVFGCQFHPEKSGVAGLRIFEEFLRL